MFDVQVSVAVNPDDVLDELSDQAIIDYLKGERGIKVEDSAVEQSKSRRLPPQNLRERLCYMFDLAAMSSKEEILEYIKSAI